MIAATPNKQWTDEELMALPDDGCKYELIDGELAMSPAGFEHGDISVRLTARLMNVVTAGHLGAVLDSSTGFKMRNGNVLSPDVSFVAKARLQGMKQLPKGFFEGAPDLAVEVLSPDDRVQRLQRKMRDYFENGTRLAWVVNPDEQSVLVYRGLAPGAPLGIRDTLEAAEIVPGFSMPVSDLFAPFPWPSE